MNNFRYCFLFLCFFISGVTFAQNGIISGKIYDNETNDILPFANVYIKDSSIGTTSDFEGNYTLSAEEGSYTLVFSFIGYQSVEITDVKVAPNQEVIVDATLSASSSALDEVIISANTARNTAAAILTQQRRSVNLTDGISAQTFSRMGASEVSSAVKTVPGVSLQGGKYVYVRGLGDRYTKTILNDVDIPGLDPDRNTIQLDVFPTNLLDNIIVIKSATADLPADFTGGMVNIVTKDFPSKEEYSLSVSGTYNPQMHFNSDFLKYEGSATDAFGFDNGDRDLPVSRNLNIPGPYDNNSSLTEITKRFNPNLAAQRATSFMDYSAGFTAGNQYSLNDYKTIGYIGSVSYKNSTEFFEDFESNSYLKPRENSEFELRANRLQRGDIGKQNVLISGLAGLSYKTEKSKYNLNLLHIQNGESTAGIFTESVFIDDAVDFVRDNLEYTQRSISSAILSGKHTNADVSWTTEWKLAPTLSKVHDKDVRITTFEYNPENDTYTIRPSSSGNPTRIWRTLDEVNLVGKLDFTRKHELFGQEAVLKFGAGHTYKQRDFSIDLYRILIQGAISQEFNGDADAILSPGNIWTPETNEGSYIDGNYEIANTFDASNNNTSVYASEEFKIIEKLRTIVGLRMEQFSLSYTGQNQLGTINLQNEKIIDNLDFFPSASFIYSTRENTNIRLSYAKTTARPSFKEASIAQIYDPLTNRTFIGNIDLKPTYIDNVDLRYEIYGEDAQLFAVSAFAKRLQDPIELTVFSEAATDNFQPRNVGEANILGAELEVRRHFGFLSTNLNNLSFNLNLSVVHSEQEMDKSPNGEYESRVRNARVGETVEDTRELQGQSPYLLNMGLNYIKEDWGLETGIFYNVQGKTLEVVGLGTVPDVYTMPFNSLNFTLSKRFGETKNSSISLKVSNILNDEVESRFQSFGAEDQIFSRRTVGTPISIGYSYKF